MRTAPAFADTFATAISVWLFCEPPVSPLARAQRVPAEVIAGVDSPAYQVSGVVPGHHVVPVMTTGRVEAATTPKSAAASRGSSLAGSSERRGEAPARWGNLDVAAAAGKKRATAFAAARGRVIRAA